MDNPQTDPEQVVAEALHDAFGGKIGYCHHETSTLFPDGTTGPYKRCEQDAEPIVAALKAAGALMPEDVERLKRNSTATAQHSSTYIVRLTAAEALLQEALSVLGRHTPKPLRTSTGFYVEHCRLSNEPWPCPEASLAEKIEKAIGGEG